jgi:hypothetical protein
LKEGIAMTAMPTMGNSSRGDAAAPEHLYERDEVEWYEAMAALIGQGRIGELDFPT